MVTDNDIHKQLLPEATAPENKDTGRGFLIVCTDKEDRDDTGCDCNYDNDDDRNNDCADNSNSDDDSDDDYDQYPVCPLDTFIRTFSINAIRLNIVINKAGEHNPDGLLYVLEEDEDAVRALVDANPFTPVDAVRPLVIRANAGDCIEVKFKNKLDFPASIHIQGVQYDVIKSNGTAAGNNYSSVVQPGKKIKYRWYADREGVFYFSDLGNPVADETGSNVHGLWGALIVEAPGATWTDPVTGEPLKSGLYADIHHPAKPHFREYTLFFHDEFEVNSIDGGPPIDPDTGLPQSTMTINYRSEPGRIRMKEGVCQGEECMMSSWPHGDPATPVLHAYRGDPAKIRLIHAGVKETHVFHLHVHQWRLDPKDPNSTLIDSISFGPQEVYTIEPLFGAGSLQQAFGDVIWHCHLYPHFAEGMWGLWRVHDVLEDGSRFYPDGTEIRALQPLPDRTPPPLPTPDKPGFPLFIPGAFGQKAPRPPLGIVGGRPSTPLEEANFDPNPVPGGAFVNPCPTGVPVREFHIVGIQLPIIYNSQGWQDPQGRIFVLAEDEASVLAGEKPIEPLVIRANAGECVDIVFTNKFPTEIGGATNPFQTIHVTDEAACHVHLVKFDILCSDGGANGWNYDSSAGFNETIRYRWYADTELRTVFFHDHMFPNLHQQHGVFAVLIVEPAGSTYHDPYTGAEIKSGARAVIKNPNQPDFREFVLAVHDFALLFDTAGNPLNPPPVPNSHDDPGVMGINYRNEPLQFRPGDPAYVFSSFVHGDPATPLLETYAGDPVRIRLFDGAHEEQHTFNLHRYRWSKEPTDPKSPKISTQTIGISEAFNFEFTADADGDQDILYYFGGLDDLWLGLWGIMRIYGESIPHLLPMDDRPAPPARTTPFPEKTGAPPPKAADPGDPCPADVHNIKYDVVAIARDIVYNSFGDHDPDGLMFVLTDDEADVVNGSKATEPLIIRANLGDCIEVTLTNKLPETLPPTEYPDVPVSAPWFPSNRVSLHVHNLKYDARGSDGATIGFNPDQTVGPGGSITYRWFADEEGTYLLQSFGDVRNHRHRGLFGVLVVEPYGATYYDPFTGNPLNSGTQAEIRLPGREDFREFVVVAQNGISMFDKNGVRVPDPSDPGPVPEPLDFEDQGQKGFNYRSERFVNRLAVNPDPSLVFSSKIHGDPATPLFQAYAGDPVVFRYAMAADKPRNTTFAVHGHNWYSQPEDPFSNIISLQSAINVGNTYNIRLLGNAGGPRCRPGDYLYRSGIIRWDLESGMWGIFRVHEEECEDLQPLQDKACFKCNNCKDNDEDDEH
jgi:FtsP/CotA-like multicopper oxidase with cupredoxin domain